MSMYRDIQLGKGSSLYELVVTDKGKDKKAVEKSYEQANKAFLKITRVALKNGLKG